MRLVPRVLDWLMENIKEAASNALDAVVTFFTETIPNFIQSIVDWFNELPERLTEWERMSMRQSQQQSRIQ